MIEDLLFYFFMIHSDDTRLYLILARLYQNYAVAGNHCWDCNHQSALGIPIDKL
jgi:hypothetical protein